MLSGLLSLTFSCLTVLDPAFEDCCGSGPGELDSGAGASSRALSLKSLRHSGCTWTRQRLLERETDVARLDDRCRKDAELMAVAVK